MSNPDEPVTPPPGHRSRLEDEVLEILAQADRPTSLADHIRRKAAQRRRAQLRHTVHWLSGGRGHLNAGTLLVGCAVAALLAVLLADVSALLARVLAIVSIVLLLAPIVLSFRGSRHSTVKTWRGRDMDLRPGPPEWVESLRDRFRRPPRR